MNQNTLGTIILSISRNEGDKYLFTVVSINFFLTFPHIFENVVKILTGQKFDISFSLEVPFSSSEIKAILASSGKIPFGKLLFIAFDNV